MNIQPGPEKQHSYKKKVYHEKLKTWSLEDVFTGWAIAVQMSRYTMLNKYGKRTRNFWDVCIYILAYLSIFWGRFW